jgi:hypothetical protein
MASLALIAGLIFLVVLISGPLVFLLSKLPFVPRWLSNCLAILTIFIGVWWFLLPISIVRYIGLLTALLGFWSLRKPKG